MKMIYFLSDVHLGYGSAEESKSVERRILAWLRGLTFEDTEAIFLCGDIFDFWFEYEYVVPKGFVRVLAEFARLTDSGVRVVFMTGNHDMWVGEYLREECGLEIYKSPTIFDLAGRRVHVAHGDNINVGRDWLLMAMNTIFRSRCIFKLFSIFVHPNLAIKFGRNWSHSSRKSRAEEPLTGELNVPGVKELIDYATHRDEEMVNGGESPCDYYIYGHLHIAFRYKLPSSGGGEFETIFIRDWSESPTVVALDSVGKISQIEIK